MLGEYVFCPSKRWDPKEVKRACFFASIFLELITDFTGQDQRSSGSVRSGEPEYLELPPGAVAIAGGRRTFYETGGGRNYDDRIFSL